MCVRVRVWCVCVCDTSFKRAAVLILNVCVHTATRLKGIQAFTGRRQDSPSLQATTSSSSSSSEQRSSKSTNNDSEFVQTCIPNTCCVRRALCGRTRWTTRNECFPRRTERSGGEMLLDAEIFLEDGVPRVCRGGQQSCKLSKHLLPQERPAFWVAEPCQCAR